MDRLLSLPKIDLHCHLTGSIDAGTVVRIAARHGVELPTYITSELDTLLYGQRKLKNYEEYFKPWEILNSLFVSVQATREIILEVVRRAAEDNVIYVELRVSPRGFLGNQGRFGFEEFIDAVSASVAEAEARFGTIARCILGVSRHLFGPIRPDTRNRMLARIVSLISGYRPQCFVGIDLNGDEIAADAEQFEVFFRIARRKGFSATVHAGECGPSSNVEYAVKGLHAMRIGHGVAAAGDPALLSLLAAQRCALEICPTSNEMLGVVSSVSDLPLNVLREHGVPFVICSDNPARCKTSLSEELFKVATAFGLSLADVEEMVSRALEHSFADPDTKERIRGRLDGSGVRSKVSSLDIGLGARSSFATG